MGVLFLLRSKVKKMKKLKSKLLHNSDLTSDEPDIYNVQMGMNKWVWRGAACVWFFVRNYYSFIFLSLTLLQVFTARKERETWLCMY